jgi:tight adherence protein C
MGLFGVLGFLYLLGLDWPFYRVVLVTGLATAFGYVLPNVLLYNAGTKRASEMRNGLPDAMDLLTISVEAGLGFDAAVSRVAKNSDGPLSSEFARLLQEMQIGMGRTQAMRGMAERTSLPDLKSFCLAMVQADSLGIPIARVLRIQSQEMRVKRRQRAEEKAQQVPVRMMIPLVMFILPCLFLVILGPAGISIAENFSSS